MLKIRCSKFLALLFSILLLGPQIGAAKKMYRWEDENGRVFFSDQIPQDQIKHKRESLNEDARVIEVIEEAKTDEQVELEKRLQKLRKEQEKIIAKQKSHDKVLLSTFRNVEDMKMALKGKMRALDAQRKVAEGNLLRLKKQLQRQRGQAADYERRGQKVPQKLLTDIVASKKQIGSVNNEIARHYDKRDTVRKEFEADIERFIFLTQSKIGASNLSDRSAEYKAAKELGVFVCDDHRQCEQGWNAAREFVDLYSTTGVDIDTDRLIMRAPPRADDDLSLSVSKMALEDNRQQIFLDIRCRQSTIGVELCSGPKVKNIRGSFSRFIESRLTPK